MVPIAPALPSLDTLSGTLRRYAHELPSEELPALVGVLEAAKALAWSRLTAPSEEARAAVPDRASMTAGELAALYNVPRSFFYELARQHRVPCMRLGRYVRFNRADVERALTADHNFKTTRLEPSKKRRDGAALGAAATAPLPAAERE